MYFAYSPRILFFSKAKKSARCAGGWNIVLNDNYVNKYLAPCSIFINSTISSCGQIQCYTQIYINYITLHMRKPPECDNSEVTSTWCSAYVCIANWLCNKSFVTLSVWNGTSELANQRFLWTRITIGRHKQATWHSMTFPHNHTCILYRHVHVHIHFS